MRRPPEPADGMCPVIAALVRGYDDVAEEGQRQDLLEIVPRLAGTVSAELAEPRLDVLRAVDRELTGRDRGRLAWWTDGFGFEVLAIDELGRRVARGLARRPDGHARMLALVDELLEVRATRTGTRA